MTELSTLKEKAVLSGLGELSGLKVGFADKSKFYYESDTIRVKSEKELKGYRDYLKLTEIDGEAMLEALRPAAELEKLYDQLLWLYSKDAKYLALFNDCSFNETSLEILSSHWKSIIFQRI
jgi:hypothetical protein